MRELSSVGAAHTVDPIDDLRPLCANCHAMAHREQPAIPLEELRNRLR